MPLLPFLVVALPRDSMHLVLEIGWVGVGFVLYFLIQVYFLPRAPLFLLNMLAAKRKEQEMEEEDSWWTAPAQTEAADFEEPELAGSTDPATKALSAARELAKARLQGIPEEPERLPVSGKAPEFPTGARRSRGCRAGGRPLRSGGFFEQRREERISYVRGFQPCQAKMKEPAKSARTTRRLPPPEETRTCLPKPTKRSNDEHYLLELWKEAMAIPCPSSENLS